MRNGKSFAKRMITGILSAAMILTAVPTYAYAAEETDETKIIEPDLSYVEIVEDETINEESSIGAVEDYSNEENSQVNNVEENTNSNDSNDNEERGTVLANDEKQLNDEDDLSDELLSDPAESYEVSNNSGDFTVEYKDGTEEKNGKHYVSSNAKSIKISVKANTGKGIKAVTAKIGDSDLVVNKQGKGNFCNNGDGEYLITADEDGNTAINGDVEINVESDTVYTVTFVDANKNSIGVTPIPNLEEGPAAFIPNVNWDGTVKVFKGASLVFEYNVPDREYVITKVTQGENGDVLECFKTMHHEWENPCTGFHYKTSEINNDTSIYMYSDSFCKDDKVELTIVKSGFTSVVWKDDTIGTRNCSLKLYRKGDTGNSLVDSWDYSFTNSKPDTPLWIFVSGDDKSWESRWTYKEIIKQSGTYYATLEIKDKTGYNGKVYKSNEFEYTVPTSKIDTPSNFRTETREEGEFAGDRYLYWNDVSDTDCAGYEYEVVNTNKSVNCWLGYGEPNEQNGHNLDNFYNFLGQGAWTIRVRALSNDINLKNVSDWAEYTYSMENSINCGDEDEENEKYYSIRPAYDYSYELTQEEYSNIINKSGWQESENKYVERYIVKPGAQKVIVTISSRDKYIDPAKVTAKIGGKDAVVSHKTNKYGTYEYTIKKSDNTAIDRDIVINPGEFVDVRTITFSVDNDDAVSRLCDIDMYNPSKDLKKKCVVQRVDNKITFSNIPVNEDFKFKAPIARGYKISLIKSGEKALSQSSGVYTIPKGADDVNAVITTVSSGTYSIPVTPGNATVTWGNDSEASNNLSSNKINTDYKKDVYLKVVRNKGYRIDGVTMKVNGNSDDTVLTTVDNSEGDTRLFKLYEKDKIDDHNFRIATGAAITVNTTAKPAVKVTTSLKHDGEDSSDKLSISGGANVGTGDSAYYGATNKDIVLTYTLPANKILTTANVTIGEGPSITASADNDFFKQSVIGSVYKWILPKSSVENAWDNGEEIHFEVTTASKMVNISVAEESSEKVKIYKYTKGSVPGDSDLIGENPLTVPYMSETYLYVAVDPNAIIKSVKAGSTTLKTGTETIGSQQYVYYIVPAASLKDDVAITVETEAMVVFEPIYSNCSIVVTAKGARYEDGYFKLPIGTNEFTYTVETKGKYIVSSVKINESTVKVPIPVLNKTKDGLVYTFTGESEDYADKKLIVSTAEVTRTLMVKPDGIDETKLLVKSNGRAIAVGNDDKYEVEPFTTVTVQAIGKDSSFKITGAKVNGETAALSQNGEVNIFITDKEDNTVEFITEGVPAIYVQKNVEDDVLTPSKSKITSASTDSFKITLKYKGDFCKIINPVVTNAKDGFYTLNDEDKELVIDASKAADNGGKSVTLTFEADGIAKQTLTFNVAQIVTKVNAAGFKTETVGDDSVNTIDQVAGTDASYKLTLTPKTGDYKRLEIKDISGDNASVTISPEPDSKGNYYLRVKTYDDDELSPGPITFNIVDSSDDSKIYGKFEVSPVDPDIKAPTIKLTSATDIGMTFSLALPKNLVNVKNLYYVVEGDAVDSGSGDAALKNSVVAYAKSTDDSITLNFAQDDIEPGEGHARKYNIKAYLVQVNKYTGDANADISKADNINVNGNDLNKIKTLNKQSTKDPYYETKLSLSKKKTTFIKGEEAVLAVAKFSSKTTFAQIGKAEIVDSTGTPVMSSDDNNGLTISGNEIKLETGKFTDDPGKYTLRVWAKIPAGNDYKLKDAATAQLTVKKNIESIGVAVPTVQLYKRANAAATIKPALTLNNGVKANAPASKKVIWSIATDEQGTELDSNSPLYGKVTINKNNGTVTVAKDYVLSSNSNDNIFYIKATADDYQGNTTEPGISKAIQISSETYTINSISLGTTIESDSIDLSSELSSKDLLDKLLYVNGAKVDMSLVTVKVNDSKNFTMQYFANEYQITSIRKSGTYRITVTANDGGKSSKTITVKVKEGSVTGSEFEVHDGIDASNDPEVSDETLKTLTFKKTPQYITLSVLLKSDSVTKSVPKIRVTGAKNVVESTATGSEGNLKNLTVKPTAETINVEVSYKKGTEKCNEVYTIKLPEKTDFVKLTAPKSLPIWANANATTYDAVDFTTDKNLSGKYKLKFIPTDAQMKAIISDTEINLLNALNNSAEEKEITAVNKLSFKAVISAAIPKGTYKFNVILTKNIGEVGTDDYIPVSDPVELKIVATAAKAPAGSLTTDIISIGKATAAKAEISFKSRSLKNIKESGFLSGSVNVYNNNSDGEVNEFTKYFDVEVNNDKLILKRTSESIPDPMDAKDLTGWVEYTLIGQDSTVTTVKCEKIIVEIN